MNIHKISNKECVKLINGSEITEAVLLENKFKLIKVITKGLSGDKLIKLQDKKDKKFYMIKIFSPTDDSIKQICININLLNIPYEFFYPKILTYGRLDKFNIFVDNNPDKLSVFQIIENINGGDLEDNLLNDTFAKMSILEIKSILFQTLFSLLNAQYYLKFKHYDIKFNNYMLSDKKINKIIIVNNEKYRIKSRLVKLIDFGLSETEEIVKDISLKAFLRKIFYVSKNTTQYLIDKKGMGDALSIIINNYNSDVDLRNWLLIKYIILDTHPEYKDDFEDKCDSLEECLMSKFFDDLKVKKKN